MSNSAKVQQFDRTMSFSIVHRCEIRSKEMDVLFMLLHMLIGSEIGRNAKFLETLTNNKWPSGFDPSDHKFMN